MKALSTALLIALASIVMPQTIRIDTHGMPLELTAEETFRYEPRIVTLNVPEGTIVSWFEEPNSWYNGLLGYSVASHDWAVYTGYEFKRLELMRRTDLILWGGMGLAGEDPMGGVGFTIAYYLKPDLALQAGYVGTIGTNHKPQGAILVGVRVGF